MGCVRGEWGGQRLEAFADWSVLLGKISAEMCFKWQHYSIQWKKHFIKMYNETRKAFLLLCPVHQQLVADFSQLTRSWSFEFLEHVDSHSQQPFLGHPSSLGVRWLFWLTWWRAFEEQRPQSRKQYLQVKPSTKNIPFKSLPEKTLLKLFQTIPEHLLFPLLLHALKVILYCEFLCLC